MLRTIEHSVALTDWITRPTQASPFNLFARIVPHGFPRYVRVLHPMWLAPGINELSAVTFPGSSFLGIRGDWKIRTMPNMDGDVPDGARRVTWREFAGFLRVPFDATTTFDCLSDEVVGNWPEDIIGPAEGMLPEPTLKVLIEVLSEFTNPQEVFFWFPWANTKDLLGRLDIGAIQDVKAYIDMFPEVWATPEFWWPKDRTWLVASDIDSYESCVGCNDELAEALLSNGELETFETTLGAPLSFG